MSNLTITSAMPLLSFEEMEDKIKKELLAQKKEGEWQEWYEGIRRKAKIEIYPENFLPIPESIEAPGKPPKAVKTKFVIISLTVLALIIILCICFTWGRRKKVG